MSSLRLFVLLMALGLYSKAQNAYVPSIIVLVPYNTVSDEAYKFDISWSEKRKIREAKERLKLQRPFLKELRSEPDNIRIMTQKENAFAKRIDFYTSFSAVLAEQLQIKLLDRYPNALIYPLRQSSVGDTSELRSIALKQGARFVINPMEYESYIENNKKFSKVRVQLYDAGQKALLFDKIFLGNDKNPGGDWTCEVGSIDCTIHNALQVAMNNVLQSMFPRKQQNTGKQ